MKQLKTVLFAFCFFFSTYGYSTIKIGTLFYDPPFIISPNEGFDMDLSRVLCDRLKQRCQFIQMKPDQLYQSLQEGKIDFAISGITVSPIRKMDYIFSLPYMLSKGQFLTLKNSHINSIRDLKDTTVGVIRDQLSGGIFYDYLLDNYSGQFKINRYGTVENMFAALSNHSISAVFLYRSDVNYWNHNGGDLFKTLGPVVVVGEGIAIIALPKKIELIKHINVLLQQMEKDGTYLRLYKTYFSNQ